MRAKASFARLPDYENSMSGISSPKIANSLTDPLVRDPLIDDALHFRFSSDSVTKSPDQSENSSLYLSDGNTGLEIQRNQFTKTDSAGYISEFGHSEERHVGDFEFQNAVLLREPQFSFTASNSKSTSSVGKNIQGGSEGGIIPGSPFNDYIDGNGGNDIIEGDYGDDTLLGGFGSDILVGGAGNDVLEHFNGPDFNNPSYISDSIDILIGGSGRDTIYADSSDTVYGGSGDDSIFLESAIFKYFGTGRVQGDEGDDYIFGSASRELIYGGAGDDYISGSASSSGYQGDFIFGENGNDTLFGSDVDDRGAEGNDQIFGGRDDDLIEGLGGDDAIHGGSGIDTASYAHAPAAVWVDLAADFATGGAGTDRLTSIENAIGSEFADRLDGDGQANVLEGRAGNDQISGYDGHDVLRGGGGADTLRGGAGNDDLFGGSGDDSLFGGSGNDVIDGKSGVDTASYYGDQLGVTGLFADLRDGFATVYLHGGGAEVDTLLGVENLIGTSLGDNIAGDHLANLLNGKGGDDFLFGRDGADQLIGDAGNDALFGGRHNDILSGGIGDDFLFGEGGADAIQGGTGGDLVEGGAGSDHLYLGEGNDRDVVSWRHGDVTEANTHHQDRIFDFQLGTDVLRFGPGFFAEDRLSDFDSVSDLLWARADFSNPDNTVLIADLTGTGAGVGEYYDNFAVLVGVDPDGVDLDQLYADDLIVFA